MNQANENAQVGFSGADWQRHTSISLAFVTPPLDSLLRAVGFCAREGWNLELLDIARVEAMWEELDGSSTSHGFVLALTGGRRAYLQYVSDDDWEDVRLLPMGAERYPFPNGRGVFWTDRVGDLNSFLKG